MNNIGSINPTVSTNQMLTKQIFPLELQNSIKTGDAAAIGQIASNGVSIEQPLPNGELPLHYAVRENQRESVKKLIDLGASLEAKDHQGLTAIEHAVLMNNETMTSTLLGCKIGKSVQEVQQQIKCKGTASHTSYLQQKIQKISTVDTANLSDAKKAAYDGLSLALPWETLQSNKQSVLELDNRGLTLIDYAVLGGHAELVEELVAKCGIDVNLSNRYGDTLLHFAAINGSTKLIQKLLELGAKPNSVNIYGETALHFAAVKENLSAIETLVKGGADPSIQDKQRLSPLALIGANAYQKDPLAISKTQMLLFAVNALYWCSTLYQAANPDLHVMDAFLLGAFTNLLYAASTFTGFYQAYQSTSSKPRFILETAASYLVLENLAPYLRLNQAIQICMLPRSIYSLTSSAFTGLKACWNNAGYRNWDVARKAVVLTGNASHSYYNLYQTLKSSLQGPKEQAKPNEESKNEESKDKSGDWYEEWHKGYRKREDDYFKSDEHKRKRDEWQRQQEQKYSHSNNNGYGGSGSKNNRKSYDEGSYHWEFNFNGFGNNGVDPSELKKLSTMERVRHPSLDPKKVDDALKMINPDFTKSKLLNMGEKLFKSPVRKLFIEMHPDKCKEDGCTDAFQRLTNAVDTLQKCLENPTHCKHS